VKTLFIEVADKKKKSLKKRLTICLILVIALTISVFLFAISSSNKYNKKNSTEIADPSAVFCQQHGREFSTIFETENCSKCNNCGGCNMGGEKGVCTINGITCDSWAYFYKCNNISYASTLQKCDIPC